MKIVYIGFKGFPPEGGIEKYTEEVGSRLVKKGHKVTIYVIKHYNSMFGNYKGMNIKVAPTVRLKGFDKIFSFLTATILQCFSKKVDIVHYHCFGPSTIGIIHRLLGTKTVVQGHGLEWKRARWGIPGRLFHKSLEYSSVKLNNKISVVSKVQKDYLMDKYGIDSTYIPTGINVPKVLKPDLIKEYKLKGNDYILFAARLVEEKGVHYLIEAYNKLNTNIKLVIAGDAPYEDKYKSMLKKLANNNKSIIFTGFVKGKFLEELFSNAYLFVLPSEIEGLSTALLEAMSYGNCCLVSDIAENREALCDNGYTFKNMDSDDLAKKISHIINHPEEINDVKAKAKAHVEKHYLWDDIADKYEQFYKSLLKA